MDDLRGKPTLARASKRKGLPADLNASNLHGREPKARRRLGGLGSDITPNLPRNGAKVERENIATPTSDNSYGPDPFEGMSPDELDKLAKAPNVEGSTVENPRAAGLTPEREARTTPTSDSSYGPDPFEGISPDELDKLTNAAHVERSAVRNDRTHKYEYLRPKIEDLQDGIFDTLLPENGFSFSPTSEGLASPSDRFQAATEILHVRASKFEDRINSVVSSMPPGLERMKSIQKLSSVLGNFRVKTQSDLSLIAEKCLQNDKSKFDERVQAQKFLFIARDHLGRERQLRHERFSELGEIRPLARAALKELFEEFAREFNERNPIDDKISQNDFGTIVNSVGHCHSALRHVSELTENQVSELRRSAYQLRRITEVLDFAKPLAEKDVVRSSDKEPRLRPNEFSRQTRGEILDSTAQGINRGQEQFDRTARDPRELTTRVRSRDSDRGRD